MEYKVKVELNGYDYDRFEISAANEKDAAMQAVKKFADEMKTDAPGALASGAITWTVEPVRAWMTAEEGINTLGASCTVWGFLNGSVLKCKSDFYGSLFFYDNDFQTSGSWDVANQPSHVMLRIEGEEPPAPPEVEQVKEPTLYEQVKAICEGDGFQSDLYHNVWTRRQCQIWDEHIGLWTEALEMTKKHPFYKDCTVKKDAKLLCSYALQIAKSHENL